MALTAGSRIGPYEILSPLDADGLPRLFSMEGGAGYHYVYLYFRLLSEFFVVGELR